MPKEKARVTFIKSLELLCAQEDRFALMLAASIFFACLSFFEILPLVSGITSLYIPSYTSFSIFSEQNSWLPLAQRVAEGNWFPALSSINPQASAFSFFPYLSIWLHGLLIFLFGVKGSYFIGHVLIPTLTFLLTFHIFRRHLPLLWSVTLSYLTLVSQVSYSFRDFIWNLLLAKPIDIQHPFEIEHFPFPSLSIFAFLFMFIVSSQQKKLSIRELSLISALWALQSQVHILNAAFGLAFWFIVLPVRLYRDRHCRRWQTCLRLLGQQLFLVSLCLIPTAIGLQQHFVLAERENQSLLAGIELIPAATNFSTIFYLLAYFALPLLLLSLAFIIDRVDPREILGRFWYFIALYFAEIFASIFVYAFDLEEIKYLLFSRITLYLHFLYITPFLYFLARPVVVARKKGLEALPYILPLRQYLSLVVTKYCYIYLTVILLLLALFLTSAGLRHYQAVQAAKNGFQETSREIALLADDLTSFETVVSERWLTNLMVTNQKSATSLWVNKFINHTDSQEIVERFALYFKIFGYSKEEFIRFMLPGDIQNNLSQVLIQTEGKNYLQSGIGFWLAFNRQTHISEETKRLYISRIDNIYEHLNISALLSKYRVHKILAKEKFKSDLPDYTMEATALGVLYRRQDKA